jgi:sulfate permease, SulP family
MTEARKLRFVVAPAIRPYQQEWVRADILAGLAAGAVVIPQAMAYATVANMPVQFGLYTCMLPLIVYAFIGGSRTASVTTTSTIATLTASTMVGAGIAAGSAEAQSELVTLTLLVGVILLAARLLRLGSIVENINQATLVGLKVGVGLTVAAAQLPKLLGVQDSSHATGFFHVVTSALRQLGHANVATVVLSVASIAILLAMSKYLPSIPGPIIVVALGIALVVFAGLSGRGVALIPEVPQGIPLPAVPTFDRVGHLIPGALAIALMAFLETVSVARGVRRSDEPQADADRELTATGTAAVVGAFFHTLPPAGGFSQTQVNLRSGARTQISGLVTAALAVVVALFLAPVLSKLPQATLGAMVLVAVTGLVDVGAMRRLFRISKVEFGLALITALFGLTVGLLPAVAVGVLLTLYFVLREVNHPHVVQVVRHADGTWADGAENVATTAADPLVLRFLMGLYTANLHANTAVVCDLAIRADPRPKTVVLDLCRLPRVTSTILDGLRDLDAELGGQGVRLVFANLPAPARRSAEAEPWWDNLRSQRRYFDTVDAATEPVAEE